MKKHIALLLLSVGALIGSANAQPAPGHGGRGGNGFIQNLPAETQDKLAELRGTHQAERTALTVRFRNGTLSRVDFQTKMAELTERHRADMLAVLTPEQRAAFKADQARADARRTASRQAFMETYFETMAADMKLNAQKKASLKSLLDAHMAEMQPLRGQGRRGDFSARDDARAELYAKVKDLLTRDEFAIFRSYMDAHQRNAGPQQVQPQGPRQGRRGN